MNTEQNFLETDLIIDSAAGMHLKETAMWAKYLGISGIVMSAFIVLLAVVSGFILGGFYGRYRVGGDTGMMVGGSVAVVYLVMAAVLFIMSIQLLRFAKKMQVAFKTTDQENLSSAFQHLKIYFRIAGVISIITLVFSVLGVIGLLMTAAIGKYA